MDSFYPIKNKIKENYWIFSSSSVSCSGQYTRKIFTLQITVNNYYQVLKDVDIPAINNAKYLLCK